MIEMWKPLKKIIEKASMIFFKYNTPLTPKTTNSPKNGQEPITANALIFFVVRIGYDSFILI